MKLITTVLFICPSFIRLRLVYAVDVINRYIDI